MENIGKRIRSIREVMGITQSKLAAKLGVSRETIRKYELGMAKVALKNIDLLTRIADALSSPEHEISVEDLLVKPQ